MEEPLAKGRTAAIYAWERGSVLKLFREGWSRAAVEREAQITRAVAAAGLPVPAVGPVVEVSGRYGLVCERVEGVSLLAVLMRNPSELPAAARQLAELHARIHACPAPALPPARERLERKIRAAADFPVALRDAALARLEQLPDGDRLCHGDFHPDNVLITAEGPVVINWADAGRGAPLADAARTSLMLRYGAPPGGSPLPPALEQLRTRFHHEYLERYRALRPERFAELTAWEPVVAAARLEERIPGERDRLLALIRDALEARDGRD